MSAPNREYESWDDLEWDDIDEYEEEDEFQIPNEEWERIKEKYYEHNMAD